MSLYYDSSMAQASQVAVLQNFAAKRRHLLNQFQSLPSYFVLVHQVTLTCECLDSTKWRNPCCKHRKYAAFPPYASSCAASRDSAGQTLCRTLSTAASSFPAPAARRHPRPLGSRPRAACGAAGKVRPPRQPPRRRPD